MNIILCGFMGCGKSTLGGVLSKILKYGFIDMDEYIQEKQGMKISDIFEKYSENGFRDIEHKACIELSKTENTVIAAGGGALAFQRNADALKRSGRIVFLKAADEVILKRIRNDPARPLAFGKSDEEIIALYHKRIPGYEKAADIIFEGGVGVRNDAEKLALLLLDKQVI